MPSDRDAPVPGILPRLWGAFALGVLAAAWEFRGAFGAAQAGLAEQRYPELGFWHNAWLERASAAQAGLEAALQRGLWVAALAAAGLLLVRVLPPLRTPARLTAAFRGAAAPALAVAAWAAAVLAMAWSLAAERASRGAGWLTPNDLALAAWALGAGLAWVGLVTLVARGGGPPPAAPVSPWRAAHVRALLVGGAILLGGGYWLNRGAWTPPARADALERNLGLAAAAFTAWAALLWRWGHGGRLLVPAALATAAAALVAFGPLALERALGPAPGPSFAAKRPLNVIVLALDTVRVDQTSILGARPKQRDTTPNLRRLAERGINFGNAITQAPWTIPAFASVLTGKYPHEHGALLLDAKLAPAQVTLAEVLREAGYETYGVVSHMFLQAYRGFAQGYDTYDESPTQVPDIHLAASSIPVTDSALSFLQREHEKPFFLFAHYFDPHYEYLDHARWNFAEQYTGWFRDQLDFENLQKNGRLLEEVDRQWLLDLYQEEILYTDHHIGRLLDYLESSGLAATTMVVVVADHGEAFGEHGYYGHTINLEQAVLHVPLVIAPPRGFPFEPRVIDGTAETRMVFGTVLSLLGVDWARPGAVGEWSFAPSRRQDLRRLAGAEDGSPMRAFSGVFLGSTSPRHGKRFDQVALIEGRYKLISDLTRTRERLFDLKLDPGEQTPLGPGRNKEILLPMRAQLQDWVREMHRSAAQVRRADTSAADQAALDQLGYSGSGENQPAGSGEERVP